MSKQKDPAKFVFKTLSFQYKPLEKLFFSEAPKELIDIYKKFSYSKKIAFLDGLAGKLGL